MDAPALAIILRWRMQAVQHCQNCFLRQVNPSWVWDDDIVGQAVQHYSSPLLVDHSSPLLATLVARCASSRFTVTGRTSDNKCSGTASPEVAATNGPRIACKLTYGYMERLA